MSGKKVGAGGKETRNESMIEFTSVNILIVKKIKFELTRQVTWRWLQTCVSQPCQNRRCSD